MPSLYRQALARLVACLDAELLPWSAKAQELLKQQYAATGAAGTASLPEAVAALQTAAARLNDGGLHDLLSEFQSREENIGRFVAAYRRYCWSVSSLADLKLAPFHLLATEGRVHTDKDHVWHMETLAAICRHDPGLLLETPYRVVDLSDATSESEATEWWSELTGAAAREWS